jgi:DNA-directed RNA polymerase subunit K/omega
MKMREYIMGLKPLSIQKMEDRTDDVYEAVVVMSKRAKQVLNNRVMEKMMDAAIEDVEMGVYDKVVDENPEDYVESEKATTIAVNEFMDGKLEWGQTEVES